MKRNGFTLIELLIVIVVIGIISTMMLFSSTEAVTTAKASNIMANMTHIRKAVIMWYCDNLERITYEPGNSSSTNMKFCFNGVKYHSIQDALANNSIGKTDQKVSITSYLDGVRGFNEKGAADKKNADNWDYLAAGGYGVNDAGTEWRRSTWFVGYTFNDGEDSLKRKMWGRKDSLGLIFTAGERPNTHGVKPIQDESKLSTAKSVWLRIMGEAECNGKER